MEREGECFILIEYGTQHGCILAFIIGSLVKSNLKNGKYLDTAKELSSP